LHTRTQGSHHQAATAPSGKARALGSRGRAARAALWLVIACGWVTAGTMLLSMLPLFGTDQMEWLLMVHRYAGLALTLVALTHVGLLALGRLGRR
jgi:hypothetical protein